MFLLQLFVVTLSTVHVVNCQRLDPAGEISDDELYDLILGEIGSECECVEKDLCEEQTKPVEEDSFLSSIKPKQSCPSSQVCCLPHHIVGGPGEPIATGPECGFVNGTNLVRTTQGKYALQGEFPWFVAVLKDGSYECAGSLIHPQVVLTVAHRVAPLPANQMSIRVGDADLSIFPPFEEKRVEQIVVHPDYNSKRLFNDVALLILNAPVVLGFGVGTVCLPSGNEKFLDNCISGGWGADQTLENAENERLKKVALPYWRDHSNCERVLQRAQNNKLGSRFSLHGSFVCAGGKSQDTCTGDGGSPLVCPLVSNPKHYVQVGVTAWGLDCGLKGVPGVYASTFTAMDWILETVTRFGRTAPDYFRP